MTKSCHSTTYLKLKIYHIYGIAVLLNFIHIFVLQELLSAAIGGTSAAGAGIQSRRPHDGHRAMESSTFAVIKALVALISQNNGIKMKKSESFSLSGTCRSQFH